MVRRTVSDRTSRIRAEQIPEVDLTARALACTILFLGAMVGLSSAAQTRYTPLWFSTSHGFTSAYWNPPTQLPTKTYQDSGSDLPLHLPFGQEGVDETFPTGL